jgi:cysteine sulfinate desulfinase/cysteine desulfurase-like protein
MLYLDNNATTKVDENVLTVALPFLTEDFIIQVIFALKGQIVRL